MDVVSQRKERTMIIRRKRTLAVAVTAFALLVGAGSAVAAVGAGHGPGHGAGAGGGVMAGGVVLDAAADYIGVDEAVIVAARHDGQSLAQIATEHGKTVAGLEQALVTAFQAHLDEAVAAGRITATQATQALATFRAQVHTLVTRTATGPLGGRGAGAGFGYGHGSGAGMGPGQGLGLGLCAGS
jgi:hypothetical protein